MGRKASQLRIEDALLSAKPVTVNTKKLEVSWLKFHRGEVSEQISYSIVSINEKQPGAVFVVWSKQETMKQQTNIPTE